MAKSPSMTTTSNNLSVKYIWFRNHIGKEFVIHKTMSENHKADIPPRGLQGELLVSIRKFLCGW